MRFGKKPNVVEGKKTRSCVVRLEKVSKQSSNVSPSPEENRHITRTNRLSTTVMGATAKGRRSVISSQHEEKAIVATAKKKVVGPNITVHSSFQTPQQQKVSNSNMSNIRSNQKVKIIHKSNKTTPASPPPARDETPPPTIAAGRSRRSIKPNPKYASKDMVTPKVVRNVGMLSFSSRGGRTRKSSSSSDDFYNRDSEDEYGGDVNDRDNDGENDDDFRNDKAYQASEKDEQDSDYSDIEEPVRTSRSRGRTKKSHESTQVTTHQICNKLPPQPTQPTNVKRTSANSANTSNIRSTSSQLQQIRRSLVSANTQRNQNLLEGIGSTAQKRKLEEIQDISDDDSNYSMKHKQLLLTHPSGIRVKMPVRENKVNVASNPIIKSRLSTQPQAHKIQTLQTVNGSNKINNIQTMSRRAIEVAAKSPLQTIVKFPRQSVTANIESNKTQNKNPITIPQQKLLASKKIRLRSGSPKQNNGATMSISSSSSSTSSLNTNRKTSEKAKTSSSQSTIKIRTAASHNKSIIIPENVHEIKDDSPNSTMDDFETMPTFTIVNVNDIINKKGDVLITKAKLNSIKTPAVIEFSESISLDDDDDDDNNNEVTDDADRVEPVSVSVRSKQTLSKNPPKLHSVNNRKELEKKKSALSRSNKVSNQAPQILNHKLGLRNSRATAKTTTTLTATLTPDKPAPRILNSMVAKKTQPVKPMIANMDDSADESFPLSLDEDEDEDAEQETEAEIESRNRSLLNMTDKARKNEYPNFGEEDTEDAESQNTEEHDAMLQTTNAAVKNPIASKAAALTPKQNITSQRRRRTAGNSNTPFIVSSNKMRMTPAAAKENSSAATNQQVNDISTTTSKHPIVSTLPPRKSNTEKVVISKQGDKIIKKITCFENWFVINMPVDTKRPTIIKNQLEMPLIHLANLAKHICLPNDMWSSKVTLYELSPQTLVKSTFETYTGDLYEHNISEENRAKYQPSCVMFRRSIEKNHVSRMPYDRAVIFKNKTFYTNIEGKNVRLEGAPSIISSESEIEILLDVMDSLSLQSEYIEHISIVQ